MFLGGVKYRIPKFGLKFKTLKNTSKLFETPNRNEGLILIPSERK